MMHGADVASDHHLLIAKLKPKLKRNWTGGRSQRPQYDTTMLLKDTARLLGCAFKQVLEELLEEETINGNWKLPKKGDLSSCCNYKGQTLLSIPGQVFSQVLLNRTEDAVDPQLWDQQAGSCRGMSCTDQITTLCIILE